MRADEVEALFTRADGQFAFARWGRPIAPVVFGVTDETLHQMLEAATPAIGTNGTVGLGTDAQGDHAKAEEQQAESEQDLADYFEHVLPRLLEVGATGALLWCFADCGWRS